MKGRFLISGALGLYLLVVGCVALTSGLDGGRAGSADGEGYPSHAPLVKLEGLPLRGIVVQVQNPQSMAPYLKAIDEIAAIGADTVELVVAARMENGASTRVYVDVRSSPTPDQLAALIARAKENKLRVMLMPIVLIDAPKGSEWRGTIAPEYRGGSGWSEWFESYRGMIAHFAAIARDNKVELFVVGSELVSTETHAAEWAKTIALVRSIYPGWLTYSSNWDHYQNIPFWEQLDIIGMNTYWKLGENRDVKVDEIVSRWKSIQRDLTNFSNAKGKPILFVEVGWCSLTNAAHEPWDYTKVDENLDLDLQRKLYEGFFQSWYGSPIMAGFMIWEWDPFTADTSRTRTYTPKGKPAEKVLRDWMEKGPWPVKY